MVNEVNNLVPVGLKPFVMSLSYADDFTFAFPLGNNEDKQLADILISKLENYSRTTSLRFNSAKSQLLRLGTNQLDCDLHLMGKPIAEVKLMKSLGCTYSKTYTFTAMIATRIAKAKCVMYK